MYRFDRAVRFLLGEWSGYWLHLSLHVFLILSPSKHISIKLTFSHSSMSRLFWFLEQRTPERVHNSSTELDLIRFILGGTRHEASSLVPQSPRAQFFAAQPENTRDLFVQCRSQPVPTCSDPIRFMSQGEDLELPGTPTWSPQSDSCRVEMSQSQTKSSNWFI